jgi:hypothetical protein
VDRMDKMASIGHLPSICLTKWMVSYKGMGEAEEVMQVVPGRVLVFTLLAGHLIVSAPS